MAEFTQSQRFNDALQKIGPIAQTFVSVSNDGRIVSGTNPLKPEYEFDFASETFRRISVANPMPRQWDTRAQPIEAPPVTPGRTTGLYTVEINGVARNYKSLKQMLGQTILLLDSLDPAFIERLALEGTRTRRLVSRKPEDLFSNPALAGNWEKYAEQLDNDWWLNTNNSADQVKRWLGVIARVANLSWNRDIRISF